MRYFAIISFILITHITGVVAQNDFRIMFYNVENLFDPYDDPNKDDDDFLPDGFMRWTSWKYWEKLRNITRVVTAVGGMQSPALIGLCEIENDSTLFNLTKKSPLRAQEYNYIISNSPDPRGMNVALLYQRDQFKPLQTQEYEIKFKNKKTKPSRNILHVTGEVINGEILDIFICHFPSRSGGQIESEPARIEAASLLKKKTDSLSTVRKNSHIVIMGDFNDYPTNKSISQTLGAGNIHSPLKKHLLYNLFLHRMKEPDFGSYKYQGKWDPLDQFIVSGNLLTKENSIQVKNNEAQIFKADFLLEDDTKYYGKKPYRTNLGPRYIGGFSDHLPIYLDLTLNQGGS